MKKIQTRDCYQYYLCTILPTEPPDHICTFNNNYPLYDYATTCTPIIILGWLRLWQLLRTRGELGKECITIHAENVDIRKSAICYLRPMVTAKPFPSALMDSYSHDEQVTGCLPGQ